MVGGSWLMAQGWLGARSGPQGRREGEAGWGGRLPQGPDRAPSHPRVMSNQPPTIRQPLIID